MIKKASLEIKIYVKRITFCQYMSREAIWKMTSDLKVLITCMYAIKFFSADKDHLLTFIDTNRAFT